LKIDVGGTVGNVSAADFLRPNDIVLNDVRALRACADNKCLCAANNTQTDVVPLVTACQQCMFAALITRNKLPDDPRAGQASALTAYQTACNATASILLDTTVIALVPPPNWDGPFGQGLNVGTTVITVIVGALLGSGLIGVVISM
ncbi:hypothetical protein OH76DRAFT_1360156, partial [Lentinus brumalis]